MCDWTAAELLGSWREGVSSELGRLGAVDLRVTDDGWKATLELQGHGVTTSITAWSTGMLELTSSTADRHRASEADVVTEQRHARSAAHALLDEWLELIRFQRG